MWGLWPCLPSSASICGTNYPPAKPLRLPPRRRGAGPRARTRHLPSVNSIYLKKQRLSRYSGTPGVDARQGQKPVGQLEIYRRGGETSESGPLADIAPRIDPGGPRELEAAGIID